MSLAGKFSDTLPDGQGAHSNGHVHVDSVSTHAPPGAIIVPDAHLLFTGDFKRSGVDLVLTGDDRELVLHDYFKGEKRAALSSPDGAHLTGDIVNALSGHTQLAQADGSPSVAQVIGHVTKLAGTATAIRNGVSIILNQGDNVNKGDVVQSGSDSTLGITFIDGSVFGLGSNAKMVLNEMVYDPNGSSNSSLISLVQGTISFVAGATAKHGDMKVDTPVATMGIRGTAVLVEIDFEVPGQGGAPPAKFQVLVEPDGTTGSYILFDKTTLTPIATVNQAGTQTIVNGQGTVNFLSSVQLSADAQKIITDVFALKFTDLNNPQQSITKFSDIGPLDTVLVKTASGQDVPVTLKTVQAADNSGSSNGGAPSKSGEHIPGPPGVTVSSAAFTEHGGITGSSAPDTVTGTIEYTDVNPGDQPTAKAIFASFAYQNAQHANVTSSLTAKQIAAILAVEVPIAVVQDPALLNNGTATWTYSVADGAFDFLAAGETLTLTYIAQVDNNFASNVESTVKSFTVTITGTNDKPVITTGPQHIAFVGGKTTPGGPLTTGDPTSGTLSFTDVDLTDTHAVSTKLTSALLAGAGISQLAPAPLKIFETALSASIAAGHDSTDKNTGTIDWQLADLASYLADFIPAGQTLSLVYTVTVTDSQGATSSQNIVVDITGNNTPAVVWIATAENGAPSGGLWSDAANWETGTVPTSNDDAIIITDQLRGLTPSYPVTIASAATAKSLTMNDFGTLFTNSPTLINNSTLTVGAGGISLGADSVFRNNGSVTVDGLMEVLGQSTLQNSVGIFLHQGGDFKDQSVITNSGTIEVLGGTLNILVDVANTGGNLAVDGGATMTLDGATITGGNITNYGAVDVIGDSAVDGASFASFNSGQLTVAATKTLTLNGVALDGGAITNLGAIEITGTGSITNDALANHQLKVDSGQTLTLNGTTVTGGIISNAGATLAVSTAKTVTLDDVTVNGGSITDNGTVHVDTARTLTLNGVAVSGGNLTNDGTIDTTATTSLNGVGVANAGTIEATSGVLKITGSVVGSGSIRVDAGAFLELNATVAAAQKIVYDGAGSSEVQLDASTFGGQIQGMAATDELDLRTIGYGAHTTGTYVGDASGGVLTITDGTHSISMTLVGDYRHAHFAGASDGHGGTLVTLNADDDKPTFATGETSQAGSFTELSDTTGSSTSNPTPALTGTIHFTDIDLVDRPTATITSQSVTWADHSTDLSGSLSQAQIDAIEHALLLQQPGNTNNGAIGWTYAIADDALDFLGDQQTATVTSTITLNDHEGKTDTATVTITVTGANDTPVAVADTDLGHIVEAGNDTNDNVVPGVSTTTGNVLGNDTDVDITDTHNVIGVVAGNVSNVPTTGVGTEIIGTYGKLVLHQDGSWTYTLDNSFAATDALAQDEHANDIFSYTETDHHGGTSSTTLTIDVTGTNDAPVISIDQLNLTNNGDGSATIHGLSVTDPDATSTETFTMSATTAGAGSGSTVSPDSDADVLAGVSATLASGFTYRWGTAPTDMVTLTVADGHAAADTINLIGNVTGTPVQPATLTGTTAKDVFFGSGYQDQFVFAASFNHDTVMYFSPGRDHIDLSAVVSTANTAQWFAAHVTAAANPADTLVTVDTADTIVLHNIPIANLSANDFILHVT